MHLLLRDHDGPPAGEAPEGGEGTRKWASTKWDLTLGVINLDMFFLLLTYILSLRLYVVLKQFSYCFIMGLRKQRGCTRLLIFIEHTLIWIGFFAYLKKEKINIARLVYLSFNPMEVFFVIILVVISWHHDTSTLCIAMARKGVKAKWKPCVDKNPPNIGMGNQLGEKLLLFEST